MLYYYPFKKNLAHQIYYLRITLGSLSSCPISEFSSHVYSFIPSLPHATFTNLIVLFLSCLMPLSTIWAIGTWKVKSSPNCTDSSSNIWLGSRLYCLSYNTWKILWRLDKFGVRVTWYVTRPIRFKIWKGPMNQRLNFLIFMALPILVVGVTFMNMCSPFCNSNGFLLLSV